MQKKARSGNARIASVAIPVRGTRTDETDGRVSEEFAGEALFRCSQGRAEIAQFVVNLISFPYGLSDFFAEQVAVSVT